MVLVGYWPLDEGSGSTAYDHSGNENHGTINDGGDSTIPGATGILGQNTYDFDGKNDYVKVSDSGELNFSGSFTWCLFAKPIPNTDRTDGEKITWLQHERSYFYQSDGADDVVSTNVGGVTMSSGVTPQDNVWGHWTITYDADKGTLKIYHDGELKNETSATAESMDNSDIFIGCLDPGRAPYTDFFGGSISEVRAYSHALTPAEIQYLYTVSQRGQQTTSKKSS